MMNSSSAMHIRTDLIAAYKAGYGLLVAALAGITDAELDHCPAPTEWTVREIVHHCADSEMTAAIRLRCLIAEESPTIVGYDQEEFVRRLHSGRPIAGSLLAVEGARASTASLLDELTPDEWSRSGTHTESGRYSVDDWLRIYSAHLYDHADQIARNRASAASGSDARRSVSRS